MADQADLAAQIAALQTQLADVQVRLASAEANAGQGSKAQPQVHQLSSAANVPALAKFEDIQQQDDNPVRRGHQSPPTIALLDLSLESGMVRAGMAGPAIKREYEVVAPVLSYLWDIKAALAQQCSADDIPDARRQSLAVAVSALDQVVQFLHERRDLLVAKGEFKSDPYLVKAVEMGLNGTDGLPVSSSRVQQLLEKAAAAQVGYLHKQSAKQTAGPSRDT
jgi:hypothetical protein